MSRDYKINLKHEYRHIYIVDSQEWWHVIEEDVNRDKDLILTFDLGLVKFLEEHKIDVFYLDHLIHPDVLEANNYIIYDFFKNWHYDKNGKDIFTYKEIPFGFSLRLEIWNDFTSYIRLYCSLKILLGIKKETLFVGTIEKNIFSILEDISIQYTTLKKEKEETVPTFYFPIAQWMDEQIRPSGLRLYKRLLVEKITFILVSSMNVFDRFFSRHKKTIFIQEYHPTREIIKRLKQDKSLKVVLPSIARRDNYMEVFSERFIPIYPDKKKYHTLSDRLIENFREKKYAKLILEDKSDITDKIYDIIEHRLVLRLAESIRTLESCIRYLENNSIDLIVLIANIGHIPTLLHCVAQEKHIPSYLIINGLLGPRYSDEGKYATVINAYAQSIKENYFRGMENIEILGDPRMDMYADIDPKTIHRRSPTIVIGAGGFNNVDLNSYVAVEFDFMYDILSAIQIFKKECLDVSVIIKVRPNGYKTQYQDFVEKYFPSLMVEVIDKTAMQDVLKRGDLYVSIESQTLFEASCLGTPVIYYKKATELKDVPFDNHSELVTANTIEELLEAFDDFKYNTSRYKQFLEKQVMEKYIGYLDGKNLDRNIEFIYELLEEERSRV